MSALAEVREPTLTDVMAELAAVRLEIAELRSEREPAARRLVDAATLAHELGVSRQWVYEHRAELGAVPLTEPGDGRKPRLRFDMVTARHALARDRHFDSGPVKPVSGGRRHKRQPAAGQILRVRAT